MYFGNDHIFYICHATSKLRAKLANRSIKMLMKIAPNLKIHIIASRGYIYNTYLTPKGITSFEEIPNNGGLDFGKYYHGIVSGHYNLDTPYVFFINDSIAVTGDISGFFRQVVSSVEFLGFTDSYERSYHVQSYLFGIRRNVLDRFVKLYTDYCRYFQNNSTYDRVVENLELKLASLFATIAVYVRQEPGKGNLFASNYSRLMRNANMHVLKLKVILNCHDKISSYQRKALNRQRHLIKK